MSIVEAVCLSGPAINVVKTNAAPRESLASAADGPTEEWEAVQNQLNELGPKHGEPDRRIDDDGYIQPSREAVASAAVMATLLRSENQDAPSATIQDGVGGIIFEWTRGPCVERLIINRRGKMEIVGFRNSQLVFRKPASIVRDFR